jgi:ribosomal protein S12 methylthiotransferase
MLVDTILPVPYTARMTLLTLKPASSEASPALSKTTIGFVNLGCSKNQVDSEVMLGSLARAGFAFTSDPQEAEVVIINTCGFIEEAKQESIDTIIDFGRLKKKGACKVLIAAGCLSQRYQDTLLQSLPELDGVVGTGEVTRIAEICRTLLTPGRKRQRVWMTPPPYLYDEFTPRIRLGKPHSAFVKIAEGCNRNCTFCAIPLMRGKQRSRTTESILQEIQKLAAEGVTEINLISQDTINYGVDLGLRHGLATMLREAVKIEGLRWIRPFYLYPQEVSEELIDLYANEPKIAKYVDMPLQHINDVVLKRMHRMGTNVSITKIVNRFRQRVPGLTFRTGFIVGFPGETTSAFRELKRYLMDMEFDRVGVFGYSDEEGTPAAALPGKISREVMEERRNELLTLQEGISLRKNRNRIGTVIEVLVDGPSEETDLLLEGRHQGQAPDIDGVVYLNEGNAAPGDFVKAEIIEAHAYDLVGRIAD